jgi:uncharacterized membrane protein
VSEAEKAPGTADPRNPTRRTARLEAFSDGVFAIAITLLVLDLAIPATTHSAQNLLAAFLIPVRVPWLLHHRP